MQLIGPAQLVDPDSSGYIRHVVLIAGRDDLVIPRTLGCEPLPGVFRNAVQRHDPHPFRAFLGVRACHTPLTRRDALIRVERKTSDIRPSTDRKPALLDPVASLVVSLI